MNDDQQREERENPLDEGAVSEENLDLSVILIRLLKGVVYREDHERLWSLLIRLQFKLREYVGVLGLELILDESEGYAFLKSRPDPEDGVGSLRAPRLIARRPLSYPVSLLLALLRRKLAEFDASGGDLRLVLSREDILDLVRVFLRENTNEARLIDQMDAHINRVVELGFLRRLRTDDRSGRDSGPFEVRRILKAFVDAQWLGQLDERLEGSRQQAVSRSMATIWMMGSSMSEPMQMALDFASDDQLSGFRLMRLETLNWGTFNGQVWVLDLNGRNILLTGDIGSGKSTLVDAITTLLVPAHRIAFNKAAGAESKERSLRSYVQGYYKSERNEETGISRPVSLRDEKSLSVLLGVFYNAGYDQFVTLAQVFWLKEGQGQPARFFVGAEKPLTIAGDFTEFGGDLSALKRRLRGIGAEIEDTFPKYGSWYRRRFGIENEQAMELFRFPLRIGEFEGPSVI